MKTECKKIELENPPIKENVWKLFLKTFEIENKKKFIFNKESTENVNTIIDYFTQNDSFFKSKNLITNIDGISLKPSFEKGLLVVGMYGNGKTTVFKALSKGFEKTTEYANIHRWNTVKIWNNLKFKAYNANDVVTEYEGISNVFEKKDFYKKYSGYRMYFDDFKNEKVAYNFGKTEVFKEIIEKRYNKKAKTYITMNYQEGAPENLNVTLEAIGKRYGGHIYDRLFEMFNIIEFKGKSFRI